MNTIHQLSRLLLLPALIALPIVFNLACAAEEQVLLKPSISADVVKSKLEEIEASTSLDAPTKETVTELYRRALTNLEKTRAYEADAKTFSNAGKNAPEEISRLRSTLKRNEKIPPEKSIRISEKATLLDVEETLQKHKAEFTAAESQLSDLNKRIDSQVKRPTAARERLLTAKRQQDEMIAEYRAPIPTGELEAVTKARKIALETQLFALSAEISMLNSELLSHQARVQILEAQRDLAEYNLRKSEAHVRQLESILGTKRLAEAELVQQKAASIEEEYKDKHPLLRQLAQQNVALGETLTTMALKLEQVLAQDDKARSNAKRIEEELSTTRQKLEIAGLNQVLGRVLIEQRRALPNLAAMQRQAAQREQLIANSGLQQIQYTEERRQMRDTEAYIADVTKDLGQEVVTNIRDELLQLVKNRRELLDKAIATEASYLRALGELDLAQRQFIGIISTYDDYLGKRLLWVRSTEPVNISMFSNLPQEIYRLLSPHSWLKAADILVKHLASNPLFILLSLLLIILSFMRRRFQRLIVTSGNKVGRVRTDRFGYTIETLFWTLLSSAPIPLLLLTTGFLLSSAPESTEFAKATARALTRISPDMLILLFFLDTTLVGGLLLKHFRWPTNVVNKLRSEYKLLILLFLPLAFVAIHSISLDTLLKVSSGGGLGLITVVAAIGSIALFIYRMFTPNGGVLAEYLAYRSERLLNRFRKLWVGLLVTAVIGLIVLVLIGYLYTGATLTRDLINTIWLINLLILAHALAIRWLIIISRRLAYQAAIERRDEARAAREAAATREQDSHSTSMEDSIEIEEPVVDLKVLDSESRKLVNTALLFAGIVGLWLIWAPVLPAFGILDDIALWNRTAMVDGVETLSPVTLADLALALIIGIITAVAAKGLPAFLEFILLERLSMTAGGRYTATTLLRYVIVGIGVVIFFNILGGSWSQIQWLVAALGVGIGFGLQEIVANFISGLIILFERPIRVGDTVTVGETSGVVSRIQIRATTITNWDRQELLVPNKEFITNQLLNWSLSDPIIRIKISVGIAYGSDVSKAMILMKEAADENKNVLKDPASSVTFESFGDNALGLFLVAFLPSIENRIRTITELHQAINDKFNDAGIVISFPQRDVHLDTSNPLDIRIHQAEP